jgi:hypothetical protein
MIICAPGPKPKIVITAPASPMPHFNLLPSSQFVPLQKGLKQNPTTPSGLSTETRKLLQCALAAHKIVRRAPRQPQLHLRVVALHPTCQRVQLELIPLAFEESAQVAQPQVPQRLPRIQQGVLASIEYLQASAECALVLFSLSSGYIHYSSRSRLSASLSRSSKEWGLRLPTCTIVIRHQFAIDLAA